VDRVYIFSDPGNLQASINSCRLQGDGNRGDTTVSVQVAPKGKHRTEVTERTEAGRGTGRGDNTASVQERMCKVTEG
jgi:hypothetical protein